MAHPEFVGGHAEPRVITLRDVGHAALIAVTAMLIGSGLVAALAIAIYG